MAKQERLYSTEEGAYATRLALSSFRTKVSKLGIKGQRQGQKVFYTKSQLEDVYNGVPSKKAKTAQRSTIMRRAVKKRRKP